MAKHSKKSGKAPEIEPTRRVEAWKVILAQSSLRNWKLVLQALVIVAAAFWIYWPSVHGQWIGDDATYLTYNPLMNDPARLWKAWFQLGSFVEYYPIQESLQWMQWQLWHNDTFGYHLTNIILHITSALLIWRLFSKLNLQLAWWGGLIFAVHPMMVDSVALINEFKTSLSLPPFLLTMGFWIDHEKNKKHRDYWLALTFFIVAMLCKITMMMFPVVILLYAWWRRRRIGWNDLKASLPFFVVSLVLGLASIHAGRIYDGPDVHLGDFPRGDILWRMLLIGETIAFYFSRCFLPVTPMTIYPQWIVDPSSPIAYLPGFVLAGVLYYLWTQRENWGRHALLGLGFFLIMLAPFWGWHWISYMNATWILEHLLYIPIIGLIGLVVAGMERIDGQLPWSARFYGFGVMAVMVALLAFESRAYAGLFINEETLSFDIIRYNPGAWTVRSNLGLDLLDDGRTSEAVEQFRQAVKTEPQDAKLRLNLGNILMISGRISEAMEQFKAALRINPDSAETHNSIGYALAGMGRIPEAIAQFEMALRINPNLVNARNNLARCRAMQEAGGSKTPSPIPYSSDHR